MRVCAVLSIAERTWERQTGKEASGESATPEFLLNKKY